MINQTNQPPIEAIVTQGLSFDIHKEISLLALITRESINSIIITNLTGEIIWVNEAFTRTTGYRFEEAVGKLPGPLLSCPQKNMETKALIDECIKNRQPFRVEIENRKKSGGTFWWEVYYQPLFDPYGNILCFFSFNTDITEKKQLQKQLDQEREAFSRRITAAAIKAQEQERSLVSRELHDNINQVLTAVKLYLDLCSAKEVDPDQILPKCSHLLVSTINEIRDLSKRLSAPSVGDGSMKQTFVQLLERIEETKVVQIHFDPSTIPCDVIEEDLHLAFYRIAQEHLTNVIKHAGAKKVQVFFEQLEKELVLHIQDDGRGFDTRRNYEGIGLTNIRSRAEILGGRVAITSAPGAGCSLSASIPVHIADGRCCLAFREEK